MRLVSTVGGNCRLIIAILSAFAAAASHSFAQTVYTWTDPVTATPSFIQKGFGPYGSHLPGNGEQYCGPTSVAMGLYYLGSNGFSQIAPSSYDPSNPSDVAAATNLIRIIAGLAGTDSGGGSTSNELQDAVQTYFAAKGIGTSQFLYNTTGTWNDVTKTFTGTANADWFNTQLATNSGTNPAYNTFAIELNGWYAQSGSDANYYARSGGHFTDVVASTTTTSGSATMTVFNPYPSSYVSGTPNVPSSNPQSIPLTNVPNDWNLQSLSGPPSGQYQQIQDGSALGDDSSSKGVLEVGQSWSVAATARPGDASYTITPWVISTTQTINTNSGSLTVIAPVSGSGGFYKTGLGSLILTSSNSLTGANSIDNGILQSTITAGTPFGTGSITGAGSSRLNFVPDDSAPANVILTAASGSGASLAVDNGGLIVGLSKGGNTSLTVTLGGNTDGTTSNLTRKDLANLEIEPDAGLSALGNSIQLKVASSGSNLPAVTNGMVSPWIVGVDSDGGQSGAFLNYVSGTGFTVAATTRSSAVDINGPGVSGSTVYQADTNVTVTSASAAVYALSVGEYNVSGSNVLAVGSQVEGDVSGVILNGGTISTSGLNFGASEADIYTSADGGVISSTITSSAGLVKFGGGILILEGNNSSTLSGSLSINNGTLVAANSQGSATGSEKVYIESQATLQINSGANVAGPIVTQNSAVLYMNGGTASGSVNILGSTGVQPGAVLQGKGTIAGTAVVAGTIQAGPVTGGIIAFTGSANLSGANFFWQLDSLVDDSDSAAGTGWNGLDFSGSTLLGLNIFVDPSLVDGPDGSNSFWNLSHQWTLFTINGTNWSGGVNMANGTFDDGVFSSTWVSGTTGATLDLVFTPVPEPTVLVLLLIGGILFAGLWKKPLTILWTGASASPRSITKSADQ